MRADRNLLREAQPRGLLFGVKRDASGLLYFAIHAE